MTTQRIQGVILDWAGTTIDYGCLAPVRAFTALFADFGLDVNDGEARAPMGMFKRDHIAAMLAMPRLRDLWMSAHGTMPDDSDVERLYQVFIPRQTQVIADYTDVIPGVIEAVAMFRKMNLKIGSCTGYTRAMMDAIIPIVREKGYTTDVTITPDEVGAGRPAPFMCYMNAIRLGIYPLWTLVKIGDTVVDVHEGTNAGMWTIALAKTGNELGLSESEIATLPVDQVEVKLTAAREKLRDAGAHYVVDGLENTPMILEQINARIAAGEMP